MGKAIWFKDDINHNIDNNLYSNFLRSAQNLKICNQDLVLYYII